MPIASAKDKTAKPDQRDFELHIHDVCEIYCFLEGNCDYFVEGSKYCLHRGDIMLMRAAETHKVIIHSDKTYERMVVNFPISDIAKLDADGRIHAMFYGRPPGKYNHFTARLFPENMWTQYLEKICKAPEQERKLIWLYALLDELAEDFEIVRTTSETIGCDNASEIIRYIDRHLFEDISLDAICSRFFLSKTHLNKIFKDSVGTTAWKYITAKRLTYAKGLLQNGERPMQIFEKCGFHDYVSFYKAYKNYFGTAPIKNRTKT